MARRRTSTATAATPAPATDAGAKAWSFDASAYTYFVPDSHDIVSPVVMADHGWQHLQARYNYENFRTGSISFGYNFSQRSGEGPLRPLQIGALAHGVPDHDLARRLLQALHQVEHAADHSPGQIAPESAGEHRADLGAACLTNAERAGEG